MVSSNTVIVAPYEADMLIGGEKVDGGPRIEVRNPTHPDELAGTIVQGTRDDVNRAVTAAQSGAKSALRRWPSRSEFKLAQFSSIPTACKVSIATLPMVASNRAGWGGGRGATDGENTYSCRLLRLSSLVR
jgi:delta 1-pyrroline-5-carboxylate dehydrogenase